MTPTRSRRHSACLAVFALGLLTSLAGCDPRPPEPKATPGGTTTMPAPTPSASAASQ